MEFVQLQINYAAWEDEKVQSRRCYEVARKYGKPVIVMEPVKGGSLVNLPEEADRVFRALNGGSNASYALRFAAGFPNMAMVLSGMSDMAQMEDNLSSMRDFVPLNEAEHAAVRKVCGIFRSLNLIPCTACRYCFECPKGIQIPEIFAVYNNAAAENRLPLTVGHTEEEFAACKAAFIAEYDAIPAEAQAHNCVNCGKCKEVCPQSIDIPRKLREIAGMVDRIR